MGKSTTKKTYEYVKDYIESFGYVLLSDEYAHGRTHLEVMCGKKHPSYMVTFNNFSRGKRCPHCAQISREKSRRLNFSDIQEYVSKCDGYTLLSTEYKNNTTKLKFQCPKGHIFYMSWAHFSRGQRCSECDITKKQSYEDVKRFVELYEYELIAEWHNDGIKRVEVRCPQGHEYTVNFADFKYGYRCRICSGHQKKTIDEVKEYMSQFDYVLLSKTYKNSFTKLSVQCPKGHIYEVKWNNFKSGKRCPVCIRSKAEESIESILKVLGVRFIREYSYHDLLSDIGNPLRFDVAIFNENGLVFLVEADGEFHFKKYYEEQNFELIQYHDSLKNTYCSTHSIPLLRIPYTQFDNIEAILSTELAKYNLLSLAS